MNRFVARVLRTPFFRSLLPAILIAVGLPSSAAVPEFDLANYRGQVVLVDFWASWCGPCRQSFPWLNQMHAKYRERGLVVIGINVDRERKDAERFLKETPAQFQILYDPEGSLATRYEVPGMPSSYVYGPDGKLAEVHIGFRDGKREEREAQLVQLLSGAAAKRP